MLEETPELLTEAQRIFTWQQLGIAAGIFLLFLIFRKIFTKYIFRFILFLSKKTSVEILSNILLAFEKPMRSFFVFIGLFVAVVYFPFDESFHDFFDKVFRTLIIFHIAWGLFNLSASTSSIFTQVGKKMKIEFDDILLPFVSKLLRFAIVVMALSIIASEWEYNVSGFVAGLGLGGLAFALAAQESIKNFFGGVIIIVEKPFALGDWIKAPSVEGFVEDISFRSTKIRTFADSVIVVPNSTLSNEPIENWTKMRKRLITFDIGILYSTPVAKVRKCVDRIDRYLHEHTEVDNELIIVRFNTFNESSLDIFIYFFTIPTGWVAHMKVKEDINMKVMEILEEEGVSIAFPTRTLDMSSKEKYENVEQADEIFSESTYK
ncbi:mechanosensitive ion channel family protein [Alkalicoccus halolimnae]|uniref:Mechanosensitive ion channel family protein n=1 Tax=Alkalicoccus halolimnae TaxID=1667239 RepID=A0A5C7FS08_9BACI|nr:mechanosensitive ion channel family protein [Alkalicoccus halolimnae]TXF87485.1 mechanosensitive ion channel family protein [Alkalicoccus halolimnae]